MVETVVKVGGGLLADRESLEAVLRAIAAAAMSRRLLVAPGGGPFADAVRDADRLLGLASSTAHWMAILAMDQYAHLLASSLRAATIVTSVPEIADTPDAHVPVLAPFQWLRAADPLPHSWDVTSDSIAAWISGQVGARRLVLVKPNGVSAPAVDAYFERALPAGVDVQVLTANEFAQP